MCCAWKKNLPKAVGARNVAGTVFEFKITGLSQITRVSQITPNDGTTCIAVGLVRLGKESLGMVRAG